MHEEGVALVSHLLLLLHFINLKSGEAFRNRAPRVARGLAISFETLSAPEVRQMKRKGECERNRRSLARLACVNKVSVSATLLMLHERAREEK